MLCKWLYRFSSGSAVLGFSFTGSVVPAGDGTLVELSGDVSEDCLSDFIFEPLMALNFLLDLEVVQLMMVAMIDDGGEMVVKIVIQMYVYL